MNDVVIVGGGPGGLYASLLLARQGFSTTILEEHETAGEPVHCTGVLAADAFDEYELPKNAILNNLTSVSLFAPSGRTVSYTPDKVEAVVVDRKVFDRNLCDAAERAGVRLVRDSKVFGVEVCNDHVRINTAQNLYRARACILACGANYSLQRKLGLGFPSSFLHSAQVEVPATNIGNVEMHFGSNVAPKGFAWAVPVKRLTGEFARIGIMCDRNVEYHFQRIFFDVASRWNITVPAKPRLRMLPLAPISRTYSDRLLVIGDAAGLVKPTTGGGIYYSIVSAAIAAGVLAKSLANDSLGEATLRKYQEAWTAKLGGEIETQLALRRATDQLGDDEIEDFFCLAQTDGIIPLIRQTARFNEHRHLILALFKHTQARQILMRKVLG